MMEARRRLSMTGFLQRRITLVVLGCALLAALLGAVAWAAPGGLSPGGSAGAEATETGTHTDDETPEPTEIEGTETEEASTPEAGTPEAIETEQPEHNGDVGVPLDSPACAGDLEHPSPHDTDGDGDGCREVATDDGTINLPDPAADAHEGDPGHIGDLHGSVNNETGNGPPAHAHTPGPPDGDSPHGQDD
jgi:hypothetical protein